jgi:hypothetical protein
MLTDSENVSLLLDTNNVMVIFASLAFSVLYSTK